MKTTYFSNVTNGRLTKAASQAIAADLAQHEGKAVEVTIQRKKAKRSDAQMRYYFGVVVYCFAEALRDLGNDIKPESASDRMIVHEFLKNKFLRNGRDIVTADGEVFHIGPTTTICNKVEIGEYIDDIVRFTADSLNYQIPPPEAQKEFAF